MPKEFYGRAFCGAFPTYDVAGLPTRPELLAHNLQRWMDDLLAQGFEVLGVTALPTAVLLAAVRRTPSPEPVRWYGCEATTCFPGAHTRDCPHVKPSDG